VTNDDPAETTGNLPAVRRDPFAVKRARCDVCGLLLSAAERAVGRCAPCSESLAIGLAEDEARERSLHLRSVWQAAQIDGQPWWEAGRPLFVSAYPDLDALNREAVMAHEAGYTIGSIAVVDPSYNLGGMALGFWVLGGLGAALAADRKPGGVIVSWVRRQA
jgi:hypothetical protein